MAGSLSASIALIAALLSSPANPIEADRALELKVRARGVSADAIENGLRTRVGDVIDAWTIEVRFKGGRRYQLSLRGPLDDADDVREVILSGRTKSDRSRELATILATIIESRTPRIPRGFLALETHLGLGHDLDLGLGLGAGVWLVQDHLQPRARVAWSHGWSGLLRVNALDVGLGLAAGTPLDAMGRVWLGGLAMPTLTWTHAAAAAGAASTWSAGFELGVLVQYRLPRLVVGVRTGIETTFPAVEIVAATDRLRYGHVRWLLALELGLGFLD